MRIAAELEKSGDLAAYFPERMMARYRDGVARTVIAPSELPIGVVTALIGAPVFVIILSLRRPVAV